MKGKLSKGSFGSFVVECEVCHNKNSIYPPSRDYVKIIPRPCERQDSMERPIIVKNARNPIKFIGIQIIVYRSKETPRLT